MKLIRKLLPILVLIAFAVTAYVVVSNPPTIKKSRQEAVAKLNIEVTKIKAENLKIDVESYGTVKPRTQSILYSQVSGQIIEINPKFREGGFFEKGETLIQLDKRDLLTNIQITKSALFNAQQALQEEQARSEQAEQDWVRLGNTDKAPDLVLRKPQLMAAQAKVLSSEASLSQAKLALERSDIKAPYTGRILKKEVDIGQVVSPNTQLAEIYAVDYVEIRLPIKNKDLPYVVLPEPNRFSSTTVANIELPKVNFYSDLIGEQSWQGKVVRTEGALDAKSQQLFVVAQINDPYGKENSAVNPIKIGQYVTAKISGKVIENAITIPNKTIYQGSYVYVVEDNLLKRRNINIVWQNRKSSVIDKGLNENDFLVLTPLGQVSSGMRVAIKSIDGEPVVNSNKLKSNEPGIKGHEKERKNLTPEQRELRKAQREKRQSNTNGAEQ
ncbi:efflux RND transporter periplasmic adaptor subunit [Pseudocolwellia agarivorans]|uniref:efflux RND transporter periplasmic adaptor subunit n=1 Tax=Pseudocolwellia agarivorans TaxID=1911682 RepID=UPI001FEC5548|nr:efflux RND transporter periplasmic adaptor subunit [Pseudocolwellia agarivorans]